MFNLEKNSYHDRWNISYIFYRMINSYLSTQKNVFYLVIYIYIVLSDVSLTKGQQNIMKVFLQKIEVNYKFFKKLHMY